MERFVKGAVVIVPFPFSDLSGAKRRPALVLADLQGKDILLCQITSMWHNGKLSSISLKSTDFISGALPVDSYIRPTRIFTADKDIIIRQAGVVSPQLMDKLVDCIISMLRGHI
jgi:mRNA interferase MazF